MEKEPTKLDKQRALDGLWIIIQKVRDDLIKAKELAVYAEFLDVDLQREADHIIHLHQAKLMGYLLTAEILGWTMGYKIKYKDEISEINKMLKSELELPI